MVTKPAKTVTASLPADMATAPRGQTGTTGCTVTLPTEHNSNLSSECALVLRKALPMAICDPTKNTAVAESERLAAESHLAIAKSLIVLEEVRALRKNETPTDEEIFETIARRQLDEIDRIDAEATLAAEACKSLDATDDADPDEPPPMDRPA